MNSVNACNQIPFYDWEIFMNFWPLDFPFVINFYFCWVQRHIGSCVLWFAVLDNFKESGQHTSKHQKTELERSIMRKCFTRNTNCLFELLNFNFVYFVQFDVETESAKIYRFTSNKKKSRSFRSNGSNGIKLYNGLFMIWPNKRLFSQWNESEQLSVATNCQKENWMLRYTDALSQSIATSISFNGVLNNKYRLCITWWPTVKVNVTNWTILQVS